MSPTAKEQSVATLKSERLTLRPWKVSDIAALVRYANNKKISDWLRDGFPVPYTEEDAEKFIETTNEKNPGSTLAIELAGEVVGSAGYFPKENVYRLCSEIGYWVAEPYWGQGIATETVNLLVRYLFEHKEFIRITAQVFEGNYASTRVLEKAGFHREAILKNALIKNGVVKDEWLYVKLK